MRALITGINGFAASHLADLLIEKGYQVFGMKRLRSDTYNIKHILDKVEIFTCDILDSNNVESVIKKVEPDIIFHLAAQSFVGLSWEAPSLTISVNVLGTLNILEVVRKYFPKTIIHIASSSQVYGKVEKFPMTLDTSFNPMSPYDVSKLAQEMIARQYHKSYGIDVRVTRAFNITGPRRGEYFAETSFAKQIVQIEKGLIFPIITVGNLESYRDYVDVRDVVKGYLLSVEKGEPGEVYLLCSGQATKISDILNKLISLSTKKDEIKIEVDQSKLRPSDTPYMVGDYSETEKKLEWKPTIPLNQTLVDLLNYFRNL